MTLTSYFSNLIYHLICLIGAITKDSFFDALEIDPEEAEKEDRGREKGSGKGRKEKVSNFLTCAFFFWYFYFLTLVLWYATCLLLDYFWS